MTCTNIGQSIDQSLFIPLQDAMGQVGRFIQAGAETVYKGSRTAQGYWEELNVSIHNWTNENLPGPIAKIAQAFCYALPLIAITLFTPVYISAPISIAYSIFKVAEHLKGDSMSQNSRNFLPNALGFSNSITSIYKIALGIITTSYTPIISGGIDAIKAVLCFSASGLLKDITA